MSCYVAKGDLPLTITWSFHGKAVDAKTPNISTLKIGARTSLLTLENVNFSHSGTYTCVAKNDAGSSQHSAELVVNGNSYTGTRGKKELPVLSFSLVGACHAVNRLICFFFVPWQHPPSLYKIGTSKRRSHIFISEPFRAHLKTSAKYKFVKKKRGRQATMHLENQPAISRFCARIQLSFHLKRRRRLEKIGVKLNLGLPKLTQRLFMN